jgi:group I intron endonuclease
MTGTRTGSIYKIICSKSNDIYIGSTFNALRSRMAQHKRSFEEGNGLANYPVFAQYGWQSLTMIFVETYKVVDRQHLEMYEQLWINNLRSSNLAMPFNILKSRKGSSQTKVLKKRVERARRLARKEKQKQQEIRGECQCGGSFVINRERHFLGVHQNSTTHKEWVEANPGSYDRAKAVKDADKLMKKLSK